VSGRPFSCAPVVAGLLLSVAAGCTTTYHTNADNNVAEGPNTRVGVGLHVRDAASLWRGDASRPLLAVSAGPARVERMRNGDAFLLLGRAGRAGTRVPIDAVKGSPAANVFVTRPRDASDELTRLLIGVQGFVAEPAAALPETVAGLLRRADDMAARADMIDLARYLVRVDPTRLEGTFGPRGRVTGWVRLKSAGRQKLLDALRAAGETEREGMTQPTSNEGAK
jgi:hypothetical protein